MPLTNKKNTFQEMKEGQFIEGGAMNSFGEKFDFEGKEFRTTMKYNLLGTTMNYFIENSILEIPDYIKIDVDGIEHLILEGGDKFLTNQKVKFSFFSKLSIHSRVSGSFVKKVSTLQFKS